MTQVAVRLDEAEVAALDELVRAGRFPSRAAAIRDALGRQRRAEQDREIAAAYARGYGERPQDVMDEGAGRIGVAAMAEFYQDEPPWATTPA
ncbi:MAG: ribbon-helix-helix domain-containing protein [Actinomycetota bacterium]|nr:ribbon-helix-helix domain-containing protein [Actinomycetota bacterium]